MNFHRCVMVLIPIVILLIGLAIPASALPPNPYVTCQDGRPNHFTDDVWYIYNDQGLCKGYTKGTYIGNQGGAGYVFYRIGISLRETPPYNIIGEESMIFWLDEGEVAHLNTSIYTGFCPGGDFYWVYEGRPATAGDVDTGNTTVEHWVNSQLIRVTDPNGGEVWAPGSTQTISWTYSGNVGSSVRIELWNTDYYPYPVSTITTTTPIGNSGTGIFNWSIPLDQATRSDYRIRVVSNENSSISDFSNIFFSIGPIPLIPFPNYVLSPTDPDRDGFYEDVNGNGRLDFNDVVLYFKYMLWIRDNEPVELFDYNGNGRTDFNDVVKLFKEL